MRKTFNIAGPCRPAEHYMLPTEVLPNNCSTSRRIIERGTGIVLFLFMTQIMLKRSLKIVGPFVA